MIPETGAEIQPNIVADLYASIISKNSISIKAPNGVGATHSEAIPLNSRITMEIETTEAVDEYGLYLRSREKAGYRLNFSRNNQTVSLGNTMIKAVSGLSKTIKLDIIMKDDIIDVSIDNKRCIVNRTQSRWAGFYGSMPNIAK